MATRKRKPAKPEPRASTETQARAWLDARNLIEGTTSAEKHLQMQLRLARLSTSLHLRRGPDAAMAVADLYILLVAIAEQMGAPLSFCVNYKLRQIRLQEGSIVNGRWTKEKMTP